MRSDFSSLCLCSPAFAPWGAEKKPSSRDSRLNRKAASLLKDGRDLPSLEEARDLPSLEEARDLASMEVAGEGRRLEARRGRRENKHTCRESGCT